VRATTASPPASCLLPPASCLLADAEDEQGKRPRARCPSRSPSRRAAGRKRPLSGSLTRFSSSAPGHSNVSPAARKAGPRSPQRSSTTRWRSCVASRATACAGHRPRWRRRALAGAVVRSSETMHNQHMRRRRAPLLGRRWSFRYCSLRVRAGRRDGPAQPNIGRGVAGRSRSSGLRGVGPGLVLARGVRNAHCATAIADDTGDQESESGR
jgi:hypothetical protein